MTDITKTAATLYGDGVHDDTAAIQELLDSGRRHVALPEPESCYIISSTLLIHSRQQLSLPRYATIRLADGANCTMLKNAGTETGDTDITVNGGIWDMNNLGQAPNPFHIPHPDCPEYLGLGFEFVNVERLTLTGFTLKDAVTFAVSMNKIRYFTVEDICFDFNYGNPNPWNMDGIHLNGSCFFGVIRNLHGACYDDMVALNADEGIPGPISDIQIDGLFSADCHSAVRLLSREYPVTNISITNVYGSFYQYCIGLTKYYAGEASAYFDGISISRVFAVKAVRHAIYAADYGFVYPYIWIEGGLKVRAMTVCDLHRDEKNVPADTVRVDSGAKVDNLVLERVYTHNSTGSPMPMLRNDGVIGHLSVRNCDAYGDEFMTGNGESGEE